MSIELTSDQRDLLLQLVDSALGEIGPEIRRTMTSAYKEALKEQRRALQALHDLLAATTGAGCRAN